MVMDDKELEKKMREEVKQLRRFYLQISYYCLANGLFILIWALSGFGYFWPFWPILIWGALLLVRGEELDSLPEFLMRYARLFRSKLPFLREDWTEAQVKKRMASRRAKNAAKTSTSKSPSVPALPPKTVTAPKTATAKKESPKSAAKKPVAKKPAAKKTTAKKSTAVKKPTTKTSTKPKTATKSKAKK